jgi:lysine-N-methylase
MKDTPILMPRYMRDFRCTGAACPANCCHGIVDIDRETYRKYKHISDPALKEKLASVLTVRKAAERSDDRYAFIDNAGRPCAFLDQGRCQIQLALGAGYLSRVCHTVPRVINKIHGITEISCKMLCPEAVRLALDNPGPMSFDLTEGELDGRYRIDKNLSDAAVDRIQPAFFAIRDLSIDILQDRRYGFPGRMIRLGAFIAEIGRLDSAEAIEQLIEKLRPGFDLKLDKAAEAENLCGHYLDLILGLFVAPTLNTNGPQYHNLLSRFLQGLAITSSVTPETVARYRTACARYYEPFMNEHQYILENYFVSYVFSRLFPLRSTGTALDEYHKLMWYYLALHTILVGIAANSGELDKAAVLDFIARFATIAEAGAKVEGPLLEAAAGRRLNDLSLFYAYLRPGQN